MKELENKNIVWLTKIILMWVTIISIILEMIIYPSWGNLAGCIMMVVSYIIFIKFFLKRELIVNAPFSFFMFISMFLYRYMPLIGTIIEGKPVSYGMKYPIETFFMETLLFVISCMAFYFSFRSVNKINLLQKILNTCGFYNYGNERVIWILGVIGFISRVVSLAMGNKDTGNAIGSLLHIIDYYMYTPVILFFPCLYNPTSEKKIDLKNKKVWIYLILISFLNLATNSRNEMITPFCILILLLYFVLVIQNVSLVKIIRPSIVIKSLSITFICLVTMNMVSQAMLINRSIRDDLSFTELIENTYETLTSKNLDEVWKHYNNNLNTSKSYDEGWTEEYIDNYLLNRFCNIRITDETLYLGKKLNYYSNNKMLEDFKNRIVAFLPQPIIEKIGLNFNKENYYNSRGDILYVYSGIGKNINLGGYRVTSSLGDGLATFGMLYFIIQFIMWYFVMNLLNSFSIKTNKNGRVYSIFGLLSAYTSLLMFSNANGIIGDFLYCLRGYWQEIILFLILYRSARFISMIKIR